MKKVGKYLGLIAGILSILLWVILSIFILSTTTQDIEPIGRTFVALFLPASLAIFASLTSAALLMLVAFLWSLPISLYMAGTPSYYALFGVTCVLYFISFLFMIFTKIKSVRA